MDLKKLAEKFFSQRFLPEIILVAGGLLLYGQCLFFGFTYLDDNSLILDNQPFLADFSNIFRAFRTDVFNAANHSAAYYRPLLTVSFMADYRLGGAYPFIYHLSNIFFHLAAAILVFVFLKKMSYRESLAYLAALIFLVHPALAQAVAWIPGRNDSLVAIFILLAFIYFIKYFADFSRRNFWLHLLFLAAAVFTKETALFAVFPLAYFSYFLNDRAKKSPKKIFFIGWAAIFSGWFLMRHFALQASGPLSLVEMVKSVVLNFPAAIQLVGKIIMPFNLSVLPIMQDTTFIYGLISLGLIGLAFYFTKYKSWRHIIFGMLWFLLFLLPSFIRPNSSLAADFIEHRLYLPMVGFFVILLEIVPFRHARLEKKTHWAAAFLVLAFLASVNVGHSRNFKNRLSFWENAVTNSPHYPLARRNYGAMQYLEGNMQAAEEEFKEALRLNPQEQMAHNNLGLIYTEQDRLDEAEEEYHKELAVNPYYDNGYFNLALLHHKKGEMEKAREYMEKTLEINPGHTGALFSLAVLAYSEKDLKKATAYVQELARRGFPLPSELKQLLEPLNALRLAP